MDKKIFAAASCNKQKYFFDEEFNGIPNETKKNIKTMCVTNAEKFHCNFMMGFYGNGDFFFEAQENEQDFNFDAIGIELEIARLKREEKEFIHAIQLWYMVFKTEEGKKLRSSLKGVDNE